MGKITFSLRSWNLLSIIIDPIRDVACLLHFLVLVDLTTYNYFAFSCLLSQLWDGPIVTCTCMHVHVQDVHAHTCSCITLVLPLPRLPRSS